MTGFRYSLKAILISTLAVSLWVPAIMMIGASPGWGAGVSRYVAAIVSLTGVTVAIQRILPNKPGMWALSAVLASVVVVGALLLIAGSSASLGY